MTTPGRPRAGPRRRRSRRVLVALSVLAACALAALALRPTPREAPPAPSPGRPAAHCTNSDGTACPASYFTGPLGADNLVPSRTGAFLIEYYAGVGTDWPRTQQGIRQRQEHIGRAFDGIEIEYGGDGRWDGTYGMYDPTGSTPRREQWIIDNGSFPAVSWTPDYTIGEMNRGAADAIWAKAARYWASYAPHRIMLRPFAEFNLPSITSAVANPDNGGVDYCGAPFIQAWQRMVDIFRQNGATNVGFWFTPDEGADRGCVLDSYPGDQYVDWVGADFYNRCRVGEASCYSTPLSAGPATFLDLFGYRGTCADGTACEPSIHDTFGPRKPFVIGEVGTVYDPLQPTFKGDFYRSVPAAARQLEFLRGVAFFDADVSALEGPKANWRVDHPTSNPDPYEGFTVMSQDAWFSTPRG